ncbi:MAG: TlpA family protein disulfide reductase [Flavobacteriales bacterium]|nr:TlpA family protein disulfide reductase [Flavobacteriales bacterium]
MNTDENVEEIRIDGQNTKKAYTGSLNNGIAQITIPAKSSDQYEIYVNQNRVHVWFNIGKVDVYLEQRNQELKVTKVENSPVYQRQEKYFDSYLKFVKDTSTNADFIKKAILENDQDAFVLVPLNHHLKLNQNDKNELEFVSRFLEKQPQSTKEHTIYKMIENRLKKLTEVEKINLKEYQLIDINGSKTDIKTDSTRKYTVLDFWFTSCPPCIKDHDEISKNPNMFSDLNAELIGLSTDNTQEKWISYLNKKKLVWTNYRIDLSTIGKDLGIWSFPTYIILDENENILGNYSNIHETIRALKK